MISWFCIHLALVIVARNEIKVALVTTAISVHGHVHYGIDLLVPVIGVFIASTVSVKSRRALAGIITGALVTSYCAIAVVLDYERLPRPISGLGTDAYMTSATTAVSAILLVLFALRVAAGRFLPKPMTANGA